MKTWQKVCIIAGNFLLAIGLSMILSSFYTRQATLREIGLVSDKFLTVYEEPVVVENFENKYSFFLDDEKAQFIVGLCEDFSVNSDLVVAILMKENPTLISDVVGKPNKNGTVDLGLFQLNDRCLFQKGGFLEMFWPADFPDFDPMNWKHNSYVAVRLIDDLTRTFGTSAHENIAAAYNCGAGRVFSGEIPTSTAQDYVPCVMNNLAIIKRIS